MILTSFHYTPVQWGTNGGKCGVCGDPWNDREPRAHEIGGFFSNGVLGRRYTPGQVIDIEIELTSNHNGHFELRLCPLSGYQAYAETEDCFEKYYTYDIYLKSIHIILPSHNACAQIFFVS